MHTVQIYFKKRRDGKWLVVSDGHSPLLLSKWWADNIVKELNDEYNIPAYKQLRRQESIATMGGNNHVILCDFKDEANEAEFMFNQLSNPIKIHL